MDVRIGAAPMAAEVSVMKVVVIVTIALVVIAWKTLIERVAPFSVPSIQGHSLSAVAPDSDFNIYGGVAVAA